MDTEPDMQHTLLDWDKKHGRLRIGSCVAWLIVLAWLGHGHGVTIVLAWLGRGVTTVPGFLSRFIPWR